MLQFPSAQNAWRLDVVSILAVLGEHNIQLTSQMICLSRLCYLPRLIPAPQGLLSTRPKQLPLHEELSLISAHTGDERKHLSYFADVLHGDGSSYPSHTVRVLRVTRDSQAGLIRPRLLAPLNIITVLSALGSAGLLVWAIVLGDAVAVTGILTMSFSTSVLCFGIKWRLRWQPRQKYALTDGDLVIRTANNAFTVVHCDADVSRSLYFGTDKCEYLVSSYYGRGMGGAAGGLTLALSIVLFGNASWTMQAALVVTYSLLNAAYWLAAIMPRRWSWVLPYRVETVSVMHSESYVEAVWKAIWATKRTDWVRKSQAVPETLARSEWLTEASAHASGPVDGWNPRSRMIQLTMPIEKA